MKANKIRCSSSSSSKHWSNYVRVIQILILHFDLSWAKSLNKLHFFISILTTPIQVLFGLLLPLGVPLAFIGNLLLTGAVVGLRWVCPNHGKRVSLILSAIDATTKSSQKHSILILSIQVLSHIHLDILISTTSIQWQRQDFLWGAKVYLREKFERN